MRTLLQARGIEKRYGSRVLLHDASVALGDGMKVGVLGRNGAGKSTLCRILTGEEEADGGALVRARDLRLAYLEQKEPWEPGETVMEFLLRRTDRPDWECGRTAARFALAGPVLAAPVDSLPGGFRTRVKLAAMLVPDPNFLVLDEPTNHLDLSTLLLLQDFLRDFRGGTVVVSHDREFLRATCDHTLEVERGAITLFPGPVDAYLEWKSEQAALARRTNAATEAKRAQLQTFVDRFRAKNTKATQAQSKMKEIERLEFVDVPDALPDVRFRIPAVEPRRGIAFECEDLSVGYAGRTVAAGIHLTVDRGARVAVVGDNGQGKTTLLRTLAGDLPPVGGGLRRGHGVEVSYYAQHVYERIAPDDTVLSFLERDTPLDVGRQPVLDMAGAFLFQGDDVQKRVEVLSGGERARLCLASLLLARRPVLLLDEPTNHLDFQTVEALADALRGFAGTVVFISHDRTFVGRVATEVVEVDGGRIRRRPGEYDDYVRDLLGRARASLTVAPSSIGTGAAPARAAPAAGGADAWKEQKRRRAARARAERDVVEAEARLRRLEAEKAALFDAVEADPADTDRYRRLHALEAAVEEAEDAWLAAQARRETEAEPG